MREQATFLAIDLGAESGRVLSGNLYEGRVELKEIHRFPNEPVKVTAAASQPLSDGSWTSQE